MWNDRQVVDGVGGTPSWRPACGLLNSYLVDYFFPAGPWFLHGSSKDTYPRHLLGSFLIAWVSELESFQLVSRHFLLLLGKASRVFFPGWA